MGFKKAQEITVHCEAEISLEFAALERFSNITALVVGRRGFIQENFFSPVVWKKGESLEEMTNDKY